MHEAPEKLTVRRAARLRHPLDGSDAQALEGALQQVERELEKANAEIKRLREVHLPNTAMRIDSDGCVWLFFDAGPAENDMIYCYSCGKPIQVRGGGS